MKEKKYIGTQIALIIISLIFLFPLYWMIITAFKPANEIADECGEWQIVENFPDFTVQVVESFPDIEVKTVNNFPGKP